MTMADASELGRLLAEVRHRWQRASWLTTLGHAAAAAALPLAAVAVVASATGAPGLRLAGLVLLALACACAAAGVAIRRRPGRPDDRQVARFIGERVPTDAPATPLGDALVSAVDVIHARAGGVFDALVVSRAVALLHDVDRRVVVTNSEMRRAGLTAVAGGAVLLMAVGAAAPHLHRAAGAAWLAFWPQSVRITVHTGDVRVPAGQPLLIEASVGGRGARWLAGPPRLVVSADGQERAVEMRPAGDTFGYALEAVDRTFAYRVTAASVWSAEHVVTALYPAQVTRIDLEYRYPGFTGLAPRHETDGGDIYGPAGTTVRLLVHADKHIASGAIALADGSAVDLSPAGPTSASADLVLQRDDAYRVRLVDGDGIRSRGDVEYFIRIMIDRPPDVRIVRPASDQAIMPLQEVVIEAHAADDHGIASLDLVYQVAGREPRTVAFTHVTGTDVARTGVYTLEAEALGVQPGDVITYYARARDVPRGRRPVEARSDMFILEVRPFGEEFAMAESQALGGGPAGTQIDSLIAAQKEIISATWNLERRSGAGRSAEDVQTVRRAQADVKARTERLVARGRSGWRGGLAPQQQVQPLGSGRGRGGIGHIGEAIEAMGRAADELDQGRTADAIPHETAALQALLRAQAEVRRRQVLQQAAAGGGGGSSRADRDLSSLFDRELQRQQRTSYETPPRAGAEERAADADTDLADRLRDLARRQDELARRHRDMSEDARTGEEAARQLEHLAREQEEIRRQLDQMARRQEGGARGAQGGGGGLKEAADAARRAAEAAGGHDTGQAASRGERAAEALRQAERQVRAASPDAQRRAAGALQIEAHQIAEAQRRVSADASRLGADAARGGGAAAEARRRLADEQERLADRLDVLEQAARDLAGHLPGPERSHVSDALVQLESERIAPQMREEAGRLREPSATTEPAGDRDGRIARALERLAGTLAGSPEGAAHAGGDLKRTRELREQLDRLERQLRDAEARARDADGGASPGAGRAAEAARDLERAREAYARGLAQARQSLGQMSGGQGGWAPEHHEFSRSAPGTEAFKQDVSDWASLRKDLDHAIQQYEAAALDRTRRGAADERVRAGGSEAVPGEYRDAVARYFEALARTEKP